MFDSEIFKKGKEIYNDGHKKIIVADFEDGKVFRQESNSVGYDRWYGYKETFFTLAQLKAIVNHIQAETISMEEFKVAQKHAMETHILQRDPSGSPAVVVIDAKQYNIRA